MIDEPFQALFTGVQRDSSTDGLQAQLIWRLLGLVRQEEELFPVRIESETLCLTYGRNK